MGISHIGNAYDTTRLYGQMSSGNRITSAAVDPAGMAQAERMEAQQRTQKAAMNNVASAQDASKIADGAMGNITDSLQRMRDLGVQAQNGLLTDTDRNAIQAEINQLAQGISDTVGNTNYNTRNLLDGSSGNMQISMGNANTELTTNNMDLSSLGVSSVDISSNSNFLSEIDNAISNLSEQRTLNGAQYNGYEFAYSNLSNNRLNTTAGLSRKADMDLASGMTEVKKKEVLQQYQMQMQRKRMENKQNSARTLFS